MKKIFIIGATGFIGKHLVKKLSIIKNLEIICLIRKTTKKGNIDYLKKFKTKLIYGDLEKSETLGGIPNNLDSVFYLAGGGNVSSLSKEDCRNLYDYNIKTLKNFLISIKKIKKLIFFSSVSAIGIHPGEIINEETKCNPTIPHEKCKYEAEQLIKKYSKIKNFNFSILRPSIVYGEFGFGDSFNMFKMINKSYFFIPGDGKNITPWVYVEDVVDAAILLMQKGKNEEYIINHKEKISFNRIIKFVSKELNKKTTIIHVPVFLLKPAVYILEKISLLLNLSPFINMYRLKSMTSNRLYSIRKIQELGYDEKTDFNTGMRKTIKWYKKNGYL